MFRQPASTEVLRTCRALIGACAAALALLAAPAALCAKSANAVGFQQVEVPNGDEPPLTVGVWYPTSAHSRPEPLEGAVQTVALSGSVKGQALPLVVMSHGGGGSYAGHYDTALALARAGFVAAAVSHAGDTYDDQSKVLMLWRRPAQLSRLISYMQTDWRGGGRIDRQRIGAFGFSNGGFAVLVLGGGRPDLKRIDPYCRDHPDHDLCAALRSAGVTSVAGVRPPANAWQADRRVKAIVSAAPAFGFAFDEASLKSITVPIQLWRAGDDRHQPHPWYEEQVRAGLAAAPDYRVVPHAGHYAFLPPCADGLKARAPQICLDAPDFDRAAFHRDFNAAIVEFFARSLR